MKLPEFDLPLITKDLERIGGLIKESPEDFEVEEIPLYEPGCEGEHLYISVKKRGISTRDLQQNLADLFGIPSRDIGFAGMKDKWALTTQTFSLLLPIAIKNEEAQKKIQDHLEVELLWLKRHQNKLRTGHLLGNTFRIVLSGTTEGAMEKAQAIAGELKKKGLPNFYGDQRFGGGEENLEQALAIWKGRKRMAGWKKRFFLSVIQSHLFNYYLLERIQRGWFDHILQGDLAKKTDRGGIFLVEDQEAESPRFENREITFTGPIYGTKMRWPEGEPKELEEKTLQDFEIPPGDFKKHRLPGSRRAGKIYLEDLSIEPHEKGLLFSFPLPKGSYATVVMREFTG